MQLLSRVRFEVWFVLVFSQVDLTNCDRLRYERKTLGNVKVAYNIEAWEHGSGSNKPEGSSLKSAFVKSTFVFSAQLFSKDLSNYMLRQLY